ncbi:uncharacterized protein LOC126298138 [Schistocerca gregaria]|uniref:uncharacterized protein LOC126298138 n=1 Tax=Schistocerca gregaria TaxID=7010 RepID=UPI00211DF07B|nr:uncharacterized protein LOC126298138 [Schistocerca gregaria]
MEFLTFLLCVFVVSAVLKQPTTNSGNFTPIVPGYELPDRQYEKGPGFSQVSSVLVTVDNTALSSDMDDFSEQYDQENTDVEFINRLRSGMENKERIQQYSTETAEAEMEYLEQWYDEFSVTTEHAKLDTHTPQSETNTTNPLAPRTESVTVTNKRRRTQDGEDIVVPTARTASAFTVDCPLCSSRYYDYYRPWYASGEEAN